MASPINRENTKGPFIRIPNIYGAIKIQSGRATSVVALSDNERYFDGDRSFPQWITIDYSKLQSEERERGWCNEPFFTLPSHQTFEEYQGSQPTQERKTIRLPFARFIKTTTLSDWNKAVGALKTEQASPALLKAAQSAIQASAENKLGKLGTLYRDHHKALSDLNETAERLHEQDWKARASAVREETSDYEIFYGEEAPSQTVAPFDIKIVARNLKEPKESKKPEGHPSTKVVDNDNLNRGPSSKSARSLSLDLEASPLEGERDGETSSLDSDDDEEHIVKAHQFVLIASSTFHECPYFKEKIDALNSAQQTPPSSHSASLTLEISSSLKKQEPENSHLTLDLSSYSAHAVKKLVAYLYLGEKGIVDENGLVGDLAKSEMLMNAECELKESLTTLGNISETEANEQLSTAESALQAQASKPDEELQAGDLDLGLSRPLEKFKNAREQLKEVKEKEKARINKETEELYKLALELKLHSLCAICRRGVLTSHLKQTKPEALTEKSAPDQMQNRSALETMQNEIDRNTLQAFLTPYYKASQGFANKTSFLSSHYDALAQTDLPDDQNQESAIDEISDELVRNSQDFLTYNPPSLPLASSPLIQEPSPERKDEKDSKEDEEATLSVSSARQEIASSAPSYHHPSNKSKPKKGNRKIR